MLRSESLSHPSEDIPTTAANWWKKRQVFGLSAGGASWPTRAVPWELYLIGASKLLSSLLFSFFTPHLYSPSPFLWFDLFSSSRWRRHKRDSSYAPWEPKRPLQHDEEIFLARGYHFYCQAVEIALKRAPNATNELIGGASRVNDDFTTKLLDSRI